MSLCGELKYMRIVDLTHPIAGGMPVFPGDPPVRFDPAASAAEGGYNVTRVSFGTHAGTHVDVPQHIGGDGTVDRLDLEACIGPAEVVDLTGKGPNSEITAADMERFSARIRPGCRLLLRTDWSKRSGEGSFFCDFPGITPDAAEWIAARSVRLLGLEQPSVHPQYHAEVHAILLNAGIVLVETMANLASLRQDGVWLVVLPLKLAGLDGSPVRAVGIEGMGNSEP